jgi:hypothetical protein
MDGVEGRGHVTRVLRKPAEQKKEVATMADKQGVVIENVKQEIAPGQEVYDIDGHKLGIVDQYDLQAGWMKVEKGTVVPRDLYIPFSAITSIDPLEIYLSLSRDTLQRDYASPPPRTTIVEGGETAITTEPSGYDGAPVVVDRARVDEMRQRISQGMRVFTADGAEVGTVKRFDQVTGLMLVEKGVFTHRDLYVPVTVVESVEGGSSEIYLSVYTTDLQRMQQKMS